ncbi:MAG: NAD-dependent epimerase/dehydratase family protein [Candidatus Dormibacteraceae bacterium]
MIAFVTGGTGFIGRALIRRLLDRKDEVVALVRNPARAADLAAMGVRLVEGEVSDPVDRLAQLMKGADGVFHLAGQYRVGVPAAERRQMYEANVVGTERVLDAAVAAAVPRILYVSTINVFGDTHGEVVDEDYRRPGSAYLSYYDETKYVAHRAAQARAEAGAPIVIVQPGAVYGPDDYSLPGRQLEQAAAGRLPALALADVGLSLVHVDDVAAGILQAHDRGRPGRSYVLGGEIMRLREALGIAARIGGHRLPALTVPTLLLRLVSPLGFLFGPAMGYPPGFDEMIRAAAGVTYWASDARARSELGYSPRDLESGLRQTLAK